MPFFKFAKQADAHYQYPERGMTAHGATLSFPRVPAKVPSPSFLQTFAIVGANRQFAEFTTYALGETT